MPQSHPLHAGAGSRAGTLHAVNLARYLAALYLVLFHLLPTPANPQLENFFSKGYIGTSFFFLLSGFVLTHVYWGLRGGEQRQRFWLKRLVRLYPVYLLGFGLGGLIMLFGDSTPSAATVVTQGLLYLTALQTWVPGSAFVFNMASWSISTLLFFYFVFPWALTWLRALTLRQLLAWGAGIWVMYLVPPALYVAIEPDGVPGTVHLLGDQGPWLEVLKVNPLLRLPEFVLGMIGGVLYRAGHLRASARWDGILVGSLVSLVLVAVLVPVSTPLYPLLHNGLLTPITLVLVLALAFDNSVLSRLGATPLGQRLADSSLALFVTHVPLWIMLLGVLRQVGVMGAERPPTAFVLASLAALAALSVLIDQLLLRPFSKFLTARLLSQHPPQVQAANARDRSLKN